MTMDGPPLSAAALRALQFLDRQKGAWYCTHCWAGATDADARTLYRLSVLMGTQRGAKEPSL
jgi:hypothetical protein